MKQLLSKLGCLSLALLFVCLPVVAEDSIDSKYDKRVEKYRNGWKRFAPSYTKLQFYGGMGLVSVGTGWSYGKHRQWETDVLLGLVPKYSSDHARLTLTLKQNFIPWHKPIAKRLTLEPLSCGLYLNTIFGDEFWVKEPDRYPKGYYGFSSRIRAHIYLGQRLTWNIPEKYRFFSKAVTLFYELSSYDLFIVSAFKNSSLDLDDYLRLSFGLKFQIF